VAFFTVVDEAGFERRLDAGDDAFVNIGFSLFATRGLDIDVSLCMAPWPQEANARLAD